jgi:hypothetical protein
MSAEDEGDTEQEKEDPDKLPIPAGDVMADSFICIEEGCDVVGARISAGEKRSVVVRKRITKRKKTTRRKVKKTTRRETIRRRRKPRK